MKKLFGESPLPYIVCGVLWFVAAALHIAEQKSSVLIGFSLAVGILYCAIGIILWLKENRSRKK